MSRQGCLKAWFLCVLSLPAVADIYRWTDEQGRIHFSDRKQSVTGDVQVVAPPEVNTYEGRVAPPLYPQRDYRAEEEEARARRKEARLKAEAQQARALQQQQKCDNARNQLNVLDKQSYNKTDMAALLKKRQRREQLKDKIKRVCQLSSR